jgi:kynurenine formamidase
MTDVASTERELPSNWGRWGPDDEQGTLNFITDEVRRRGVAEARTGQVVSLAMPVTPVLLAGGGPVPQGLSPMPAGVLQMMGYTGTPANVDTLVINSHHATLTHIDALSHVTLDGEVYPGVPHAAATAGGTIRHGSTAAFANGIVTRGVLLDLAPGSRLESGYSVTASDLERAERTGGVRVESGDALMIRGGWTLVKDFIEQPFPFITLDVVEWMNEREVSILASDIGDRPPSEGAPMALHAVALPRLGMPLIDVAELALLGATCSELGRYNFLFSLGVMAIHGTTGLPVNPLAIF